MPPGSYYPGRFCSGRGPTCLRRRGPWPKAQRLQVARGGLEPSDKVRASRRVRSQTQRLVEPDAEPLFGSFAAKSRWTSNTFSSNPLPRVNAASHNSCSLCPIAPGLCAAMLPEAKKYHAYARECLELAEQTDSAQTRQKLIELSRVWMEAALREEGILKPRSKAVGAS